MLFKFKCCECDFWKRKVGDSSAFGVFKITINLEEFSRAHGNLQKTKAKIENFTKGVSWERWQVLATQEIGQWNDN